MDALPPPERVVPCCVFPKREEGGGASQVSPALATSTPRGPSPEDQGPKEPGPGDRGTVPVDRRPSLDVPCVLVSTDEDRAEDAAPAASAGFTRQQWLLLIVVNLTTLTSALCICLFPPYYPKLAESRGITASVYGVIIGINCLTSFIVTPVIGNYVYRIGLRNSFAAGVLVSGLACFCLGFLEHVEDKVTFIALSSGLRVSQATANAFIIVAQFSYSSGFPGSIGTIFSWTRTVTNVGQMLGPFIGGALLDAGGFELPFFVMGALQSAMVLPALFCLPNIRESQQEKDDSKETTRCGFVDLVCTPALWLAFGTMVVSTMTNGFLSVTLEAQVLRQFGLSHMLIGVAFGSKDGFNSLACPLWGYVCDRYPRLLKVFILIGGALVVTCFVLLGPFPGLDIQLTLAIVIVALALDGVGIAGQQVSALIDALNGALGAGFPDSPATHGTVAGLWSSLSGAGRFVSRCISGLLVDKMGFRNAVTVIVGLESLVIVSSAVYLILRCLRASSALLPYRRLPRDARLGEDETVKGQTAHPTSSKVHPSRPGSAQHRSLLEMSLSFETT